MAGRNRPGEERKKPRPKDVFGRPLPTEEEFEVLKNAPRYVQMILFFVCQNDSPTSAYRSMLFACCILTVV